MHSCKQWLLDIWVINNALFIYLFSILYVYPLNPNEILDLIPVYKTIHLLNSIIFTEMCCFRCAREIRRLVLQCPALPAWIIKRLWTQTCWVCVNGQAESIGQQSTWDKKWFITCDEKVGSHCHHCIKVRQVTFSWELFLFWKKNKKQMVYFAEVVTENYNNTNLK